MGDISTWSAVDNSNNAAPPDGWPENMAPSAVNNCARAVMGAVRRWYDTVTAQLSTITTSLTTYLPLTGGTMTGSITAPYIHSTGAINADTSITTGALHSTGDIGADGQITAAYIHSFGSLNADVSITTGALHSTGAIGADGNISASGNVSASGSISGTFISAVGTITANYLYSTGDIHADGNLTAPHLIISGDIIVSGTVSASTISSAGIVTATGNLQTSADVDCAGNVNCDGSVTCNVNLNCGNTVTAYFLHSTGNVNADVGFAVGPGGAYAEINSSGSFNVTGAWSVISDQSVKEQVKPYTRGLAAIAALSPVTFRYQAGAPFADGAEHVGLMAQDVELIIPELVGQVTIGDQMLSTLSPGNLVYVLCNALKELAARVEQLETAQE